MKDVKGVLSARKGVYPVANCAAGSWLGARKKLEAQSTAFTLISTQALKTGETPFFGNIPSQISPTWLFSQESFETQQYENIAEQMLVDKETTNLS